MSSEVNVNEVFYGTIDPGFVVEFYDWEGSYNSSKKRAWSYNVAPDPWIPIPVLGKYEVYPNQYDLQITALWTTVWVDEAGNPTFQRNARMENIGGSTCAYHMLRSESDN
jgi:hypothetical protein